jgi:hypothetical protein
MRGLAHASPWTAVAVAAVATLALSSAHAAPCSELPNPVYVTGGGKVVLSGLAKALHSTGVTPIYKLQGSCLAVDAVLNGTALTGTATYWDDTSELSCDLDPMVIADLGISDVFATTCVNLPSGLPANVGDFFGPVQAYVFAVPKASTQSVISAAAAYFVYGFGGGSGVAPWNDEARIFRRDAASGTQQMISASIGVPADRFRGTAAASSSDMVAKLKAALPAEGAIGLLTSEVADANRDALKSLAFQDRDQSCGYWPDSRATAFDKRNVRDGHYSMWGPLHMLTKLNGSGYPRSSLAADLIAYLTGTKLPPGGLDLIQLEASSHTIPQCAMHVRRVTEGGPLSSFQPPEACGCYFDFLTTDATSCTPCTSSASCPTDAPTCNYGYCEAQ